MLPPSPEAELQFLSKLQRLFAEGDFAATHKFALLMALADLSIELGADDGGDLILANRQIGERFISHCWKYGLPYSTGVPVGTFSTVVENKRHSDLNYAHELPQLIWSEPLLQAQE